ncbi:SHD1 domain-containing protein [Novipirellula artificiosorum]|uniref:SLA1 homology domain-containing protein n=1 Tax=Novipirellula artificiosorum TaxID=2528016 RepID=A0A5C6DTC8_9BACT|nr:SHD1 domain-containing protein [Novipirellula artificiosorum]TWU39444.1 hypothetical protein Poly41_22680 [Novipirellula artificiosorum]
MHKTRLLFLLVAVSLTSTSFGRDWSDETGNYTVSADLIAYSDTTVVLKKEDDNLVSVPIKQLSGPDRAFVKSQATAPATNQSRSAQTWTLKSGLTLPGRIIGYHEHDVVVQRKLGRVYVNNARFENLPAVYRETVPKIVEYFTSEKLDGEKGLEEWAREQKGEPRKFKCSGVLIELEDDNLYCFPFFLFSDETYATLKPGWDRWLAAKENYEEKEQESFLLQAQAEAYEKQQQQMRQVQQLQLNLQAYDAGLFDLWEVAMYPQAGNFGTPLSVVVPANDSQKAAIAAQRQNPGYVVGPMRIVRRR